MTVGVAGVRETGHGLIAMRQPLFHLTYKISSDADAVEISVPPYASRPQRFDSLFEESPFHQRGWVFQEDGLSPRTLNHGAVIFWECREAVTDDLKQCQNLDHREESSIKGTFYDKIMSRQGSTTPDYSQKLEYWANLVQTFTEANLSFGSDRITALTGE